MNHGLHMFGASVGSKYTSRETAGDGSTITEGSLVRYVPSKHSIFDYRMPQPESGSVGRVVGDFYEFYKQMWARVYIDGQIPPISLDNTWDIRTRDLRSPDAPKVTTDAPKVTTDAPHAAAAAQTIDRRRSRIGARPLFFVTAALAFLALVIIGGRP